MRQEMRKLNRAKYAHSAEEVKQLTSQGFVPVGQPMDQAAAQTQIPAGADDSGQAVVQEQVSDGAEQTADYSTQKKRKEAGKK